MSKNKGEYHYAVQALESRLAKIKKRPAKFKNADARIRSIESALQCLRLNNLPQRVEPRPLDELLAEQEAEQHRAAAAARTQMSA